MKKLFTLIITVPVFIMSSILTLAQSRPSNKTILDSLEVLKKVGGFVDGYTNPPTAEETRYHTITLMLFSLPFTEAKKLLTDKNKFARCYGFSILTIMYFDSLTKADLEIFKDKSPLPLYTQRGIIDAGITLGQYCEMAYTSTIQERTTRAKQPEIIEAIKSFINTSAKFPESYEPLDFKDYTWAGSDNDISYEIRHLYKLKQKDGATVSVEDYFILDKDFKIMLIETTRSKTIKIYPPKIDDWIKTYGKD